MTNLIVVELRSYMGYVAVITLAAIAGIFILLYLKRRQTMKIKKPTDNELRKQIKSNRIYTKMWTIVLMMLFVVYIISGYIGFLIIMLAALLFAIECNQEEMFDKIRLEIRGLK